jgi:hypothetical protein
MVQVANGFGLVSVDVGDGTFYTPGDDTNPTLDTSLTLAGANPSAGLFDSTVQVSALLQAGGQPLAGQTIEFKLGPGLSTQGITGADGRATVTLNLVGRPGPQKLYAAFSGAGVYKSAAAVANFTIKKQQASLEGLTAAAAIEGQNTNVVITLLDEQDEPLREQTIFFVITDPEGVIRHVVSKITNLFGRAALGPIPTALGPGNYTITVYFNNPANPLTSVQSSDAYSAAQASTSLTVSESPCTAISTPEIVLWQPNHSYTTVDLADPSGQTTITITGISQDEPVGNNGPDGKIIDNNTVQLRAEREGGGQWPGVSHFLQCR